MTLTFSQAALVSLLLSTARVAAWAAVAPPFATSGLPRAVKPAVALALALAVAPLGQAHAPAAELAPLAGGVLSNVLIGGALGLGTRLIFAAVESAGGLIDLFGGFSLSFALDPLGQTENSVFGRFYALLTTTLLFASPAHQVVIEGFLRTFQTMPLDAELSLDRLDKQLVPAFSNMFLAALQIAGPLIVVLVIADLAMGLLNRIAPQLNVFSLSFPFKIMLTLSLVGLGFALLPRTIDELAENAVRFIGAVT